MYTAVLMLAMTTGAESMDHGRRSCRGCSGCYASYSCHQTHHGASCTCSGGYYRTGTTGYYYGPGTYVAQGPATVVRQSGYLEPNQGTTIRVMLPNPDAELWFDNAPTMQRGTNRIFFTPSLDPSANYRYTVKAQWTENGRTMNQERRVDIQPGQNVAVDFRFTPPEAIAIPRAK